MVAPPGGRGSNGSKKLMYWIMSALAALLVLGAGAVGKMAYSTHVEVESVKVKSSILETHITYIRADIGEIKESIKAIEEKLP